MPKFYFSILNHGCLEDTEGTKLPDLGAARQHAYAVAREIMRHRAGMLGHPWPSWTMCVKNSQGEEVLSFALSDAQESSRRKAHGKPDKSAPQSGA